MKFNYSVLIFSGSNFIPFQRGIHHLRL